MPQETNNKCCEKCNSRSWLSSRCAECTCSCHTPPLNIDAEFDKRWKTEMVRHIERCFSGEYGDTAEGDPTIILMAFIENLLHEVIQREREELKKKVEVLKEKTREETGSFKYDTCYDDVIALLTKDK